MGITRLPTPLGPPPLKDIQSFRKISMRALFCQAAHVVNREAVSQVGPAGVALRFRIFGFSI